MIKRLDNKDERIANLILNVQIPAYKVEAQIIGFDGIPQLKDTVETITSSTEIFIGYKENKELKAFLSYTESESQYQICRLVVHPKFFKQGIAKKLVNYFLNDIVDQKKIIVSTGADNLPAINLYKSSGFIFTKKIEVVPSLYIAFFERV